MSEITPWPNLFKLMLRVNANSLCLQKYLGDITASTVYGSNALHFAVTNPKCFLNFSFVLANNTALADQANHYGETPLHWACKEGSLQFVEALLQEGVDVNATDATNNTPLHWVAEYERFDLLPTLLAHGASTTALNTDEDTPLDIALFNESSTCASLLQNSSNKPFLRFTAATSSIISNVA